MPLDDFTLYSHCDYAASARISSGKGALRVPSRSRRICAAKTVESLTYAMKR